LAQNLWKYEKLAISCSLRIRFMLICIRNIEKVLYVQNNPVISAWQLRSNILKDAQINISSWCSLKLQRQSFRVFQILTIIWGNMLFNFSSKTIATSLSNNSLKNIKTCFWTVI
jgi:hypothetical protein